MSTAFASLPKILKDKTRQKIILLLKEKNNLTYTELMTELKITSTGKLNYHLKTLADLLYKKDDGAYALTEKGKLVSKLLTDFPDENRKQLGIKPKWWKKFWIGAAVFVTISTIIVSIEYFLGNLDFTGVYRGIISILSGVGLAYMIQHITRDILSKKTRLLLNEIMYVSLGVWLGLCVSFFGVLLISILSVHFGGPSIAKMINTSFETITLLAVPAIIGGIAGYRFGKKRDFKRPEPKYAI
jgi:DNA-binding HxlR family transcriptional regulator